jgi:hypothetical protein
MPCFAAPARKPRAAAEAARRKRASRRPPTRRVAPAPPSRRPQWPKVLNAPLAEVDPELYDIIEKEKNRQFKVGGGVRVVEWVGAHLTVCVSRVRVFACVRCACVCMCV